MSKQRQTQTESKQMNNAQEYQIALVAALDARAEYELAKNAENDSMKSTLSAIRKTISHEKIAEFFYTSNVDANLINSAKRSSARFNVYSYEKVLNVAQYALSVAQLNHYTLNILKTAIAFAANDMTLTHDDAQSACSLKMKARDAKREKLISKYQKHVAQNTATVQSSSSIAALVAFDILRETRDAANVTCFKLNLESEALAKIQSKLAA